MFSVFDIIEERGKTWFFGPSFWSTSEGASFVFFRFSKQQDEKNEVLSQSMLQVHRK